MEQHLFDAIKAKGARQVLRYSRFSVHLSMGAPNIFFMGQPRVRLGLMLLSQQIIHGFYWVECGQWNLYKYRIPVTHGSIPQSR